MNLYLERDTTGGAFSSPGQSGVLVRTRRVQTKPTVVCVVIFTRQLPVFPLLFTFQTDHVHYDRIVVYHLLDFSLGPCVSHSAVARPLGFVFRPSFFLSCFLL